MERTATEEGFGANEGVGGECGGDLERTRRDEDFAFGLPVQRGAFQGRSSHLLSSLPTLTHLRPPTQAGVIGFHISGIELSAEDEVRALRAIMGDFRSTLAEAKARGNRKPGQGMEDRTLPPAPVE